MSILHFDQITESIDPDKVQTIYAFNQIIPSLDVMDKCINLSAIVFMNCTMQYDDIVHYDFSKFKHLEKLIFIGNSTDKKYVDTVVLASIVDNKLCLNDIDCAHAIINNGKWPTDNIVFRMGEFKYICNDKFDQFIFQLEKEYNETGLTSYMSFEEIKNKYDDIASILFEYQKEILDYNYQLESKIPLNKSIFEIPLVKLQLSSYHTVPFFDLLSASSPITNTLESLIFNEFTDTSYNMNIPTDITFCKMFTHQYYQYVYAMIKQNKIKIKLEDNKIVFDNDPICKFLCFRKLNNPHNDCTNLNIFRYLACDTLELFNVEKNRATVDLEKMIHNLVLYYGDICYYYDFCNADVVFKEDTTHIFAQVIRYQQLNMYHKQKERLVMTSTLPHGLKTLYINFRNEYHDNYHSSYSANNYIFDKLPDSLTSLTLINVANDMKLMIEKMSPSCKCDIRVDESNEYDEYDE